MNRGGEKRTVETQEIREGNTIKTIVTETVISPSGQKSVSTKTTIKTINSSGGGDGGCDGDFGSDMSDKFNQFGFNNNQPSSQEKKPAQPKQNPKEFIEDAVRTHNEYRRKHRVGDIKHNPELSEIAQKWAEHMAQTNAFQHSTNSYKGSKLGENIATKWSSAGADYTGKEAVEQWYSEVSKYDFDRATFTPGTGHFTQVVWKGSSELGMGKAKGKDGRVYVVANYSPAGNMMGDFAKNVFRP